MVEAASRACSAPAAAPATAASVPQPNWDAMANAFASQSVALTWGSILLALIGLVSAAGWGYVVKRRAEEEARDEARKCAKIMIQDWLTNEAPGIIRKHVELLQDVSPGRTDDDEAADEMGQVAG